MAQAPQVIVQSQTAYVDYVEFEGDSLDLDLTWKDELDAIVDFTAYTGKLQIRATPSDVNVLLTKTTGGAGITLGNAVSNILVEITDTDTATLGVGKFFYDLELTAPNGKKNTYVAGAITLNQSITQP